MQFLKYAVAVFAFMLLFLFGGTLAIASATTPPPIEYGNATLKATSATVELKRIGADSWTVVKDTVEVHEGDSISTNETGAATIVFYDQGMIRLDNNTSITLTNMDFDPENPEVFQGGIFLESGQLWSRLLNFMSPESSYEVRTPTTVATVRGTIFSVWQIGDMSQIYVDHHSVQASTNGQSVIIEAGQAMAVDPKSPQIFREEEIDERLSAWIEKNRADDRIFEGKIRQKLHNAMRTRGPFTHYAERIRLAATRNPELRAKLTKAFALREKLIARIDTPDLSELPKRDVPQLEPTIETTIDTQFEMHIEGLDGLTFPITDTAPQTNTPVEVIR